jgi:hypothetical protein
MQRASGEREQRPESQRATQRGGMEMGIRVRVVQWGEPLPLYTIGGGRWVGLSKWQKEPLAGWLAGPPPGLPLRSGPCRASPCAL